MALKKCPRCELNYILDDAPICSVCNRDIKGDQTRDALFELCSVCNENPSLPGKDMCLFCLKEMEAAAEVTKDNESAFENPLEMEEASEMEEIEIDTTDIPHAELGEIDRELSLDDILAEEEQLDNETSETGE